MELVKIAAPVKTKHGENSVEGSVEVPQYSSLAEITQTAGGEDKVVAFFNKKIEQSAIAAARAVGPKSAATATADQIIATMQEVASKYNFAAARTRGSSENKQKAEKLDFIASIIRGGNYSQDDLLAALAGIN